MKIVIIFLVSFISLSHQMIMPAMPTLANPEDSWSDATKMLWNGVKSNNATLVTDAMIDHANVNAQDKNGQTPLMLAAENGHAEIVRILIKNKADLDTQNNFTNTALIKASEKGHTEIVRILVDNGADLNLANSDSYTALIKAIAYGHKEIVRILVDHGADVNMTDDTRSTPLIYAVLTYSAKNGDTEVVRILVDNEADLKVIDNDGLTALMYAAKKGDIETVRLLLDFGADPDQKNKSGKTARLIDPEIIDKAILANKDQALQELGQYSEFAAILHKDLRKYAHPAVIEKICTQKHQWKTSKELAALAQSIALNSTPQFRQTNNNKIKISGNCCHQ